MAEIEWSRLSSKTYEDMVGCLLSHKNPKVRRIDRVGSADQTATDRRAARCRDSHPPDTLTLGDAVAQWLR
jgi:hypothetical protein